MDLGKKIYELRKQNNITQEELAKAVGVTTPAVCKWETGVSMPDIMLLAPIARKLNTNLDALMSFRETLSSDEIAEIISKIKDTARQKGLNAALELANEYLKQYPNVDVLKLSIANMPLRMAHTADEEYQENDEKFQKLLDGSTKLLEELINSKDDDVRMSAIMSSAARYMGQKRFDEAEAMLKKLPDKNYDAKHMYPSLYLMKGEDDKVLKYSQINMLQDVQNLLVDIRGQHSIYMKNKNYDKAEKCAGDYLFLIQTFGVNSMCQSVLLLNTYLVEGKLKEAQNCYLNYIDEVINISGNYQDAFYYSDIADKLVSDMQDDIRVGLYKYVLLDDRYKIFRKSKEAKEKLDRLKKMLPC